METAASGSVAGWPKSVTVMGAAGLIGSGVLYEVATSGLCGQIAAVDPRENLVRAHAIDIGEASVVAGLPLPRIEAVAPEDLTAADVTLVAASEPGLPGASRREFAETNWSLLRSLIPAIERCAGSDGIVLLLSNPVDILAECLRRMSRLRRDQILGYSLNDSIRFRLAVADELRVGVERIDAWVLGEHGDGQVPLFSRIRLDGEPVSLNEQAEARVLADIKGWFGRWLSLESDRSSGWATAKGVNRLLQAARDEAIMPSSVAVDGSGYANVSAFLSLPSRLGPTGLADVEQWDLSDQEREALRTAALLVSDTADALTGRVPGPRGG